MRGEYVDSYTAPPTISGSPPHAWGIRSMRSFIPRRERFTPTCVGNTYFYRHTKYQFTVHPHMRGEYGFNQKLNCIGYGSPPHAWGIRDGEHRSDERQRFTPTCVGNTAAGARMRRDS